MKVHGLPVLVLCDDCEKMMNFGTIGQLVMMEALLMPEIEKGLCENCKKQLTDK